MSILYHLPTIFVKGTRKGIILNNVKIEKGAILKLQNMIYEHDLMHEQLQECDKEASWDEIIGNYCK